MNLHPSNYATKSKDNDANILISNAYDINNRLIN